MAPRLLVAPKPAPGPFSAPPATMDPSPPVLFSGKSAAPRVRGTQIILKVNVC